MNHVYVCIYIVKSFIIRTKSEKKEVKVSKVGFNKKNRMIFMTKDT